VIGKTLVPVIPFDGEVLPVGRFDGAAVRLIAIKANAGAGFRVLDLSGVIDYFQANNVLLEGIKKISYCLTG
jgi:hypothetical protein